MDLSSVWRGVSYSALLWALGAAIAEPATATRGERVLYSFKGSADGASPNGDLVGINGQGVLYGTTASGGGTGCGGGGCGTVFELIPPVAGRTEWTEKVLYRFHGGTDGAVPVTGVFLAKTGILYSTTSQGGGGKCYSYHISSQPTVGSVWVPGSKIGCGTVFKLTPPSKAGSVWSEAVLYRFHGPDGRSPNGISFLDEKTGALYGVTSSGGPPTQLSTPSVSTTCGYYTFNGPSGKLGEFYTGCGTIFTLTPPAPRRTMWTEAILYYFQSDSSHPGSLLPNAGVVRGPTGAPLYGTTYGGVPETLVKNGNFNVIYSSSGIAFALSPPSQKGKLWKEATLFDFGGALPNGSLYLSKAGDLYGTTFQGNGKGCGGIGCGMVFELLSPASTEKILHAFGAAGDGTNPSGGVLFDADTGVFYGLTARGGGAGCAETAGCGTVYSLTPPRTASGKWAETVLHRFGAGADGQNPTGELLLDAATGNLYGVTSGGGAHGHGTVFVVRP
jgi:uncharacterized repeat protein (TIGR03803 family)